MLYYAHTKEDSKTRERLPKSEWQLLRDHLISVADLAQERAEKFGAGKVGYLIGLAHDLGKYSIEFQNRLEGSAERVDHASAGAQEVSKKYGQLGMALAYALAGHHGGMPDGQYGDHTNLPGRLEKTVPFYENFQKEITLPTLTKEDIASM
ncbi:MAG: CRISPR-associated endonuclease Cas3'', partial [Peptococcaceae bacterium]|nr:CRISPR-associated endonuclease Cas3'' [Peptococcaceae bacterium]